MRILSMAMAVALSVVPLSAQADGFELIMPVDGAIVQPFTPGLTKYSSGHRGVDVQSPPGTAVRAAAAGRVHFSGQVAGRPSVSVDHGNGLRSTYTPVIGRLRAGEEVTAGQVIGTLQGGHCTQGCLHWGLTDGDDYFDPAAHLTNRRIRLVPMGARPVMRPDFPEATVPSDSARPVAPGRAPVTGRVTSRFGMRVHPITGVRKLHDGSDYGAACGTPVHAPWAGTITKRDITRGYGLRVHVTHDDGLVTAYAHLPRFDVSVGQRVAAGDQIGVVGNTGYSTGCHLHWMAWRAGRLVDPLPLLR